MASTISSTTRPPTILRKVVSIHTAKPYIVPVNARTFHESTRLENAFALGWLACARRSRWARGHGAGTGAQTTSAQRPADRRRPGGSLRDELKDLANYFAPTLEGVQAKCTRSPRKGDDKTIAYTIKCVGAGFTWNAESSVRIEGPKRFTAQLKMDTRTTKEHAVVTADIEGVHTGPCKGK